jgi:hypothetical protein
MHRQSNNTTSSANSLRQSPLGQEELLAGIRVGSRVFSAQELTSPSLLEWIVEGIREGLFEVEQIRMRDEDRGVPAEHLHTGTPQLPTRPLACSASRSLPASPR